MRSSERWNIKTENQIKQSWNPGNHNKPQRTSMSPNASLAQRVDLDNVYDKLQAASSHTGEKTAEELKARPSPANTWTPVDQLCCNREWDILQQDPATTAQVSPQQQAVPDASAKEPRTDLALPLCPPLSTLKLGRCTLRLYMHPNCLQGSLPQGFATQPQKKRIISTFHPYFSK